MLLRATCAITILVLVPAIADMRVTFIDAGQADAAIVQIDQPGGEPFTIVVDGGDGDIDLEDHLPGLMVDDPTVELIVLFHPHTDHIESLDWLILDSASRSVTCGRRAINTVLPDSAGLETQSIVGS